MNCFGVFCVHNALMLWLPADST